MTAELLSTMTEGLALGASYALAAAAGTLLYGLMRGVAAAENRGSLRRTLPLLGLLSMCTVFDIACSWRIAPRLLGEMQEREGQLYTASISLAIAAAILALFNHFIARRKRGIALRAMAQDPMAAALCGISVHAVLRTALLLCSVLCMAAIMLHAGLDETSPSAHTTSSGGAVLAACLMGGLTRIRLAAWGGLAAGLAQTLIPSLLGTQFPSAGLLAVVATALLVHIIRHRLRECSPWSVRALLAEGASPVPTPQKETGKTELQGICIPCGKITALIGPSGAGKTALLGSLSVSNLQLHADSATPGLPKPPAADNAGRAQTILCPAGRHVFPKLTVEENLRMGAFCEKDGQKTDGLQKRVINLFPRLQERIHQRAETLSTAEQQMLAIARALMGKPELLLIDSPTLSVAPRLVPQLIEAIARIPTEFSTTLVLADHEAAAVLPISTHAILLREGRTVFSGPSDTLQGSPLLAEAYR